MKIVLLYLRILKKWDETHPEHKSYAESSIRFLETYKQFKPMLRHELIVVNCGQAEHDSMFDEIATGYANYNGGGYDCGTYQSVASPMDCDLVLGLNTHTYFWRSGWLEIIAAASRSIGIGVYGVTASYEINPHLRTPAIAFHPSVMRDYPKVVNSRQDAADFEAGPENFSLHTRKKYPACLVTADGVWNLSEWRKPNNIFRRGDQSNCLIWDRHTDIYAAADPETKLRLEHDADN